MLFSLGLMCTTLRMIATFIFGAFIASCATQYAIQGHKLEPRTILPGYPGEARFHRWEGTCIVALYVNADGSVRDVKILKSTGHQVLDEEALHTMKTWRFLPEKEPFVVRMPCDFKYRGR